MEKEMSKEHVLEHLRAAKASHVKWVQRAKKLISGIEIQEEAIPVDSTACEFGTWFYSDGQKLNALANNPLESMSKIEQLHFLLHDIYSNIFNIYFNQPKKGFFSKLFGQKREVSSSEKEVAKEYYQKLESTSTELLYEINRLERRLLATPEEQMVNIF